MHRLRSLATPLSTDDAYQAGPCNTQGSGSTVSGVRRLPAGPTVTGRENIMDQHLGLALRQVRIDNGADEATFARRLGIRVDQLRRWESGHPPQTGEAYRQMLRRYRVPAARVTDVLDMARLIQLGAESA